jgi:hypothetical protein
MNREVHVRFWRGSGEIPWAYSAESPVTAHLCLRRVYLRKRKEQPTSEESGISQRSYWGTDLTAVYAKGSYRQLISHFTEELSFLSESNKD